MPDLLIEIETEELPPAVVGPAAEALVRGVREALEEARIRTGPATGLATPRRLVAHVADAADRGASLTARRRGPPASVAFDAGGRPTKAGRGFARAQGVDPAALERMETEKGIYAAVTVTEEGRELAAVLAEKLESILGSIPFPKKMRWPGSDIPFARPIRRVVVLHGEAVVPLSAAGCRADRMCRGHPFLAPEPFPLASADLHAYRGELEARRVVVDFEERRRRIREAIVRGGGGEPSGGPEAALLDEVANLAEWPVVIEGRLDERFLELPPEVLETALRVHLRFFPVRGAGGTLEPRFFSVMDRDPESADLVREGNERVLASRLADARFFFEEDRKKRLADRLPELAEKELHEGLGSYRDKAERLERLAGWLAEAAGWPGEAAAARRAALLAKADLVTEMVGEFPELEGTMGRIYAERDGELPEVAAAVEDHYRPRGPGDALPRGRVGVLVSLAEKLDNLAGFFLAAGPPSGAADPHGLRRQALGLIRVVQGGGVRIDLGAALREAAREVGAPDPERLGGRVREFVGERLYHACLEEGYRLDLVRAVLAPGFDDLLSFRARLEAVTEASGKPWWPDLVTLVERAANILRGADAGDVVDPDLVEEPAERTLHEALLRHGPDIEDLVRRGEYVAAAERLVTELSAAVHRFFAEVFVNVEDPARRANRLALLRRVDDLFGRSVADLSTIGRNRDGGG